MKSSQFDVIVAGGGAAGVGAAVGAAQSGAHTLLIESGPCLGGAATQKNVLTYCGLYTQEEPSRQAVGGVAKQVESHLRRLGATVGPLRLPAPSNHMISIIDPEAVKLSLDQVISDAGVSVLLHSTVVDAERHVDDVAAVIIHDHSGSRRVHAKAFVDASGDGDLAAFCGASVRLGNHGSTQAGSLGVRFGGIQPGADRSAECLSLAIRTAKESGNALLEKDEGLTLTLPLSGDLITYYIDATYNALDGASISEAEANGRRKAWAYLEAIRSIPGYSRAYIVSTGPNFGTRESRHLNCLYRITEDDVTGGARFEDVVALGAWPMEYHSGNGPTIWKDIQDKATFDIPLRALQSKNTANLFAAGRLADGDGGGGGAIRVMGTSFATGQAAGVAAAKTAQNASNYPAIRSELIRQGALLQYDDLPPAQ